MGYLDGSFSFWGARLGAGGEWGGGGRLFCGEDFLTVTWVDFLTLFGGWVGVGLQFHGGLPGISLMNCLVDISGGFFLCCFEDGRLSGLI